MTLAGYEPDEKPSFAKEIKNQISVLRKQLSKDAPSSDVQGYGAENVPGAWNGSAAPAPALPELPHVDARRMEQGAGRIWVSGHVDPTYSRYQGRALMPGELPSSVSGEGEMRDGRDMRSRASQAAALGRSFLF